MLTQFKPTALTSIPFDAVVTYASLKAHVAQATPPLALHRVTRDWANSGPSTPTFWQANPSAAWSTPGGDIDQSTAGYQGPGYLSTPTAGADWTTWEPTQLVQDWVSRRGSPSAGQANQGMLIKRPNVGPGFFRIDGTNSNYWPEMFVIWSPRTGAEPNAKFDNYRLTDRLNAGVNLANGNLVAQADDIAVAGTGVDLTVSRTYNGRSTQAGFYPTRLSFESDLTVYRGSVVLRGPSGDFKVFHDTGAGFLSPPGTSADLTKSGNAYTLTDRKSRERRLYDRVNGPYRYPTSITDRNGNAIVNNYGAPARWTSITDTQGRLVTVSSSGINLDYTIILADQFGRTWRYHYTNRFVSRMDYSVDPENKTTRYGYEPDGRLSQITTPEGRITRFTYNADDSVAKVSRVTNPATGASSDTLYSYSTSVATSRCGQVAPPGGAPTDPVGMAGCTTVTERPGQPHQPRLGRPRPGGQGDRRAQQRHLHLIQRRPPGHRPVRRRLRPRPGTTTTPQRPTSPSAPPCPPGPPPPWATRRAPPSPTAPTRPPTHRATARRSVTPRWATWPAPRPARPGAAPARGARPP